MKTRLTNLNVRMACKGYVGGHLSYKDVYGNVAHVGQHPEGIQLPDGELKSCTSTAKYIFVVENMAMFHRLINSKFIEKFGPCILFTANGYILTSCQGKICAK